MAVIFFTGCFEDDNSSNKTSTTSRSSIKVYEDDRALNIIRNYNKYKSEKRTALVIGNGKYPDEFSLKNPTNDSQAIKEVLEKVGFKVLYGENLTKIEFSELLDKFQDNLNKNGGIGLFYYAGHGMEIDGINYLVPIDAKFNKLKKIKYYSVSLNEILDRINDTEARLKIIVLDACRNDPTKVNRSVFSQGFTSPPQAEGTFIAYATSAGSTANDGTGNHGLFTKYLLKYIPVEGLDLNEVFKKQEWKLSQKQTKNNSRQFRTK